MRGLHCHFLAAALALLASLPVDGMAQIPERINLLTAARYGDLERLVEQETRDDPQPPSYKLFYLCAAYGNLKKYQKLFPCLERLEGNIRRGDTAMTKLDETPMLGILSAVGSLFAGSEGMKGDVRPFLHLLRSEAYAELRDYGKAIAEAKRAEATIPMRWNQERGMRIRALTALGLSHAFAGLREPAEKYAEALGALSTAFPYTGLTNDKVIGLAKIHLALGNYRKAYDGLRSDSTGAFAPLLALGDALGGALVGAGGDSTFTYQELPKRFLAAKTLLEIGEARQARQGFDQLLQYRQIADNGEIYWQLLYDRGRIAAAEGDLPGAIEFWRRAIEVIEQQRSTINTEANKIGFVTDKQVVYRAVIGGLFANDRHAEAFDYVERSKARALVDLLAGKSDFAVAGPDAEEIRKLLESAQAAEIEALGQAGEASRARASPGMFKTLQQQAPELASLVTVSATPVPEIQGMLGNDETLVEYYHDGEGALYAFVLTRNSLAGRRLDASGLEDEVRQFRKLLGGPVGESPEPLARRLYARLMAPLREMITGDKLAIVAHGTLHYLPFVALHDGADYLVARYSLRMLPSAGVLRYLRQRERGELLGVLAFGNPDLGDSRFDLRFAQDEALAVVQQLPQSRALLRKEATETAFRRYAPAFRIVHFATHGSFNSDEPLDSALLLARDGDSDGRLTVGKLYASRLAADVVTLSACQTGLGRVASGDDVVGLTRGFLYAGASTVVASLWEVDDRSTSLLMTRFYEALSKGDKREALRKAQLATREQFGHPFFWAAFQLTGRAD